MSPRELLAALAAPVVQPVLLLAALGFLALVALGLGLLALFGGTFYLLGWIGFGVVLLVAAPAFAGYLLQLIDALALPRERPVAELDLFLPGGRGRRLFPFLPLAALAGLYLALGSRVPEFAAPLTAVLAVAFLPGQIALFALTASPLASLDPRGHWRLARRIGPAAAWLPACLLLAGLSFVAGPPPLAAAALAIYWGLAFATLAGRLLGRLDVAAETSIAPPLESDPRKADLRARTRALNHAYGFISRGNRDGGFRHLAQQVAADADPTGADLWYFDALWQGELGEAPLFYARELLPRLLADGRQVEAMKVTLRCLAANPRFRPEDADLPALVAAAEALGNREVLAALGGGRRPA